MDSTDISDVRTITQSVTQTSTDSRADSGYHDNHVQVHDSSDSILSETQRRIVYVIGGERGETLRRTLIRNAQALQGKRNDANRVAAAMRLDVQEYLSLLEGRFATEFREIGSRLGRHMNRVRKLRAVG